MTIVAEGRYHYELPDTPYNLWMRDELFEVLRLPHDGTRVEIIGGEIVVSPGPDYAHNAIVQDVQRAMFAAEVLDPSFPWRAVQTQDLNLSDIHDGYIPDLCVLDEETDRQAREAQLKKVLPRHLELVVEVTSPSNAGDDRRPGLRRSTPTKWNGYARVGIPFYLLVDRQPSLSQTVLFSDPIIESGEYRHQTTWDFGEAIRLPDPFGFEILTAEWEPWTRTAG
ncbi:MULTISPECIES: Uma2 family endonuclease [Thermomonosporaceae]|uniref:Uma2 family endonuclease n=1 Tax=Thermomonosporaceae TaxID=2012 RepID=UPI00255A9550|nr:MULTISPECIES: Uma2 family endonuclease [Thermomonosporaceae]MDL4771481.1 Uma2 family endonuclease [Actinomadura xylanilytica]